MGTVNASELVAGQKFTAEWAGTTRTVEVHAIFRDNQIGVLDVGAADTGEGYDTYRLDVDGFAVEDGSGNTFDWGSDPLENLLTMGGLKLSWEAGSITGDVVSNDGTTLVYKDDEGDECEVAIAELSDVEVEDADEPGDADAEPDAEVDEEDDDGDEGGGDEEEVEEGGQGGGTGG